MKPITREDCELMWVWDWDRENPKYNQMYIAAMLPNRTCAALSENGTYFVYWEHCAPIEKEKVEKLVPCECRKDLPDGYFDGWLRDRNDNSRRRVGSSWLEKSGQIVGFSWENMLFQYEWSPTFDGPWQPIGKLVMEETCER